MLVTFAGARLVALVVVFLGCNTAAASPSVKVGLRSSWPAPPLFVELIESVGLENSDHFFPLIDTLTKSNLFQSLENSPSEEIYNATLKIVSESFHSDPGSLAAIELNLAFHSATPKIAAFYQHYTVTHGINGQPEPPCGKRQSWVDWYGETVCDVETLARIAEVETETHINASRQGTTPRPKILAFDHIYPSPSQALERPPRTAILYASLTSPNFRQLHDYLLSLADRPLPAIEYVFRHVPPPFRHDSARNFLSGYGVSLDLKKMDYLALDDRQSGHQGIFRNSMVDTVGLTVMPRLTGSSEKSTVEDERNPIEVDPIVPLLKTYLGNSSVPDAASPLTEPELLGIGYQATQLILDSPEPLRTLIHVSQNFPKYATSIARRVIVNENLTEEVHKNHLMAQPGVNMLWLNGAHITEKDVNPFNLLRLLRKERNMMLSLTSLGLTRTQAIDLLTHPAIVASQSEKSVLDGILDASDRQEDGDVIVWWNDIEKDKRYSHWSTSIHGLLKPMYPGQLPGIKLNLFNVVLMFDLSQTSSLDFITGAVANIIERQYPVRFGLVPIAETEEGIRMARLLYYLIRNYGRAKTMGLLKDISQTLQSKHPYTSTVNWAVIRSLYDEFQASESRDTETIDFESIISGSQADLTAGLNKVHRFADRLGATLSSSPTGHAFVNGKHFDMDDNFLRSMQIEIGQQLHYFQEKVYDGTLTNDDNDRISTYFYDLPTTSSRRSRYIQPLGTAASLRILNALDLFSRASFKISDASFVYPSQSETVPLSLFVVADLDSIPGLNLVKEALGAFGDFSKTRITFIHNPSQISSNESAEGTSTSLLMSHLISTGLLSQVSPALILRALGSDSIVESGNVHQVDRQQALHELTGGAAVSDFDYTAYAQYIKSSRMVSRDLQLKPGEHALIVNGRLVGPIQHGEFVSADFRDLEAYELRKRAEPVLQALETVASGHTRESLAHLTSMSSSVVWSMQLPDPSESGLFDAPTKPRQRNYRLLGSNYSSFESGDYSTAMYHFAVLLDPLSEAAQKWSSLVEWLSNIPDVFVEFHLSPQKQTEVPLKRFYRYNLRSSLSFGDNGQELPAQTVFPGLPIEPIYTLAMDVPPSWLVRPREALYDLDNIQLGNLSPENSAVEAVFDLDYLVVDGHARDTTTQASPRGVQLQLMNNNFPVDDTLVMANLGYLQFKAEPGVFQLEIRPGRGRDIFKMESVGNEGWDSPTVEAVGNEITLTSFEGLTLYPRLRRIPGMESADVLTELREPQILHLEGLFAGMLSRFKSLFSSIGVPNSDISLRNNEADINIFTVASGLLYERFVSIMILSVLRNTNSTVKFWFIENFLSPSFLEFIPHMAEAYNFKYELVTYKWPSWLRAQKEKQRIIWAYKILFLDVLFPMNLKKIIFVDADQIVRTDLKELIDLDLNGAAYGYTPMGDDNVEMEGFRFWKTGYWKDFLQGRPYHISALYVIDLVRFRQTAAGDILRGHYQALSQDPNSLANLDQDLPNNLQREVPIFSLHQDWLWCETWCSKDRLHLAKTIDLCQNPLTKEPKLSRARKIPEWEEYDSEIARFARKLAEDGLIRSGIVAADANSLANAGPSAKVDLPPTDLPPADSMVNTEPGESERERDEL